MQRKPTPPAPPISDHGNGSIDDVRSQFERQGPATQNDVDAAGAFIDGKIKMVQSDPILSEAEKAAAIALLEKRRANLG